VLVDMNVVSFMPAYAASVHAGTIIREPKSVAS